LQLCKEYLTVVKFKTINWCIRCNEIRYVGARYFKDNPESIFIQL